jgi:hypothetical protein
MAGFVATGIDLGPAVTGVAWHSADGRRWTRTDLPGAATARPSAVAWDGSRYVAVGVDEAPRAPRMAVWTSEDGLAWRRVPDSAAFEVGGYMDTLEYHGWAGPTDVVVDDSGALVAVGRTCTSGRLFEGEVTCAAVVWRSPEGLRWDSSTQPGTLRGTVNAGAVLGSRAVLVGASADEDGNLGSGQVILAPASAASDESWRVIAPEGVPALADVAALDGMLYAVGYDSASAMDEADFSLWCSADGIDWSEVDGLPALPDDVTSIRGAALAVAGSLLLVLVSAQVDGAPPSAGIVLAGVPAW